MTPSILLCHPCISTFLRRVGTCASALLIRVQSDPPHSSARALHKTQQNPWESLWLHHWASSLSCSPLPSLGSQNILVCCLSDLPTHQPCPQHFNAGQFLPTSAFLPVPTGSIPICSNVSNGLCQQCGDSGVVHLRQGYCWAEVIKILTAGIAVHPTHLHQKQLIWIIYILQEEYLSFQTLEELQGGLGRRLNGLICIN